MHVKDVVIYTIKVPFMEKEYVNPGKLAEIARKKLKAESVDAKYNFETGYLELKVTHNINLR